MDRRQPLPRTWLFTDERQGDSLWAALRGLPPQSGIVFRHYGLPPAERQALFLGVQAFARRKRLLLILAGEHRLARAWLAEGWHSGVHQRTTLLRTCSAHNVREIRAAERAGAALLFVSPVFPTRSHPNGRVLGRIGFGLLARSTRLPVVALGGVNAQRARHIPGAYGWAAIDAWSPKANQKRNAVPR